MKRNVLCVFSLILFLLIFCTFLSQKIEVEMLTQVELRTINGSRAFMGNIELTMNALFQDATGNHLYEVAEGTGWESGLRVQEVSAQTYSINEEDRSISLSPGKDYSFILSASRQPSYGELAEVIEKPEIAPDTYLVYYPDGIPDLEELPVGMKLLSQRENAMLLSVEEGTFPFFEHRARNAIRQIAAPDMRVYSLTAVEQFLRNLPMLAALLLILLVPVILWGYSCFLSRNYWENRVLLWINTGIVVVLLCCMPSVLNAIDLPASMLPVGNILKLEHYSDAFSLIFGFLEAFSDEAQGITTVKVEMFERSTGILRNGLLFSIVVITVESIIFGINAKHHKPKKKYSGKYLRNR